MTEEERKRNEDERSVRRRDFLKSATVTSAGVALGAGLPVATGTAEVARVELHYTCPIDGRSFDTFDELKRHFISAHPAAAPPAVTRLNVNGADYDVQIEPHWTLQRTLQYKLGLTGSAKTFCDRGECGSCTVLVDGKPVLSCTTLAVECVGKSVETLEGIAANPRWKPLIQAYMKYDAMQCGYCTSGFIVTAKALLEKNANPTADQIKEALAGNLCRCGTYPRHPKAILEAAQVLRGGK
jgi:aerobic-type carbon monoxide dehydrogenase small subunit (CoxS/CutS family)